MCMEYLPVLRSEICVLRAWLGILFQTASWRPSKIDSADFPRQLAGVLEWFDVAFDVAYLVFYVHGNGVGVGDGRLALALDVWILLCLFDVGAGRLALGTVCFTLGFLQLVFCRWSFGLGLCGLSFWCLASCVAFCVCQWSCPVGFQRWVSAFGFCCWAFGGRQRSCAAKICQELLRAARVAKAIRFAIVIIIEELRV